MKRLNKRREKFVTEYVKDGNGTKAAIRAGYSPKSAKSTASRLLTNADLQQRLKMAGQLGLDTLIDVAANGKSEYARVQAGLALMDRAWGKAVTPVEVNQKTVHVVLDLTGSGELPPADMIDDETEELIKQQATV